MKSYSNMVGDTAVIYNAPLVKGRYGEVKWSGTIIKAMLDENSVAERLDIDEVVKIVEIDGNILKVIKN